MFWNFIVINILEAIASWRLSMECSPWYIPLGKTEYTWLKRLLHLAEEIFWTLRSLPYSLLAVLLVAFYHNYSNCEREWNVNERFLGRSFLFVNWKQWLLNGHYFAASCWPKVQEIGLPSIFKRRVLPKSRLAAILENYIHGLNVQRAVIPRTYVKMCVINMRDTKIVFRLHCDNQISEEV